MDMSQQAEGYLKSVGFVENNSISEVKYATNLFIFPILSIVYIIQVNIHLILSYKIFKQEKAISGFGDFMLKSASLYPLMFKILLGKRNSSPLAKLYRINFFSVLAIFVLMLMIFIVELVG